MSTDFKLWGWAFRPNFNVCVSGATRTHLCDAQPHVSVGLIVVKAEYEVTGFVGVQNKLLVYVRRAAGHYLSVEFTIVVHVENSDSPLAHVKSDINADNVLTFFKVVLDATPPVSFDEVTLARPTRVFIETVVSSIFGPAPVRAATVPKRPLIKRRGLHYHGGPFGRIDKGWCVRG